MAFKQTFWRFQAGFLLPASQVEDVFVGWGTETAASLVAQVASEATAEYDSAAQLMRDCWFRLVSVTTVDGMLRATEPEFSEWAGAVCLKSVTGHLWARVKPVHYMYMCIYIRKKGLCKDSIGSSLKGY